MVQSVYSTDHRWLLLTLVVCPPTESTDVQYSTIESALVRLMLVLYKEVAPLVGVQYFCPQQCQSHVLSSSAPVHRRPKTFDGLRRCSLSRRCLVDGRCNCNGTGKL